MKYFRVLPNGLSSFREGSKVYVVFKSVRQLDGLKSSGFIEVFRVVNVVRNK